jgi:hypothetical protein
VVQKGYDLSSSFTVRELPVSSFAYDHEYRSIARCRLKTPDVVLFQGNEELGHLMFECVRGNHFFMSVKFNDGAKMLGRM